MLIKEIPLMERPRERMLKYGVNTLSNEELLAIVLKNGTKGISSKDLGIMILKKVGDISKLKNCNLYSFDNIKGLGIVKKQELLAIIELGKRIYLEFNNIKKIKYTSAKIIFEDNKYLFYGLKQEYFYVCYLDHKKNLIERKLLFMGTIDRSLVHPREIFKYAYLCSASGIICMHNHPSGDIIPSRADMEITDSLIKVGKIQGIELLDHIIVSDNQYFSFYDNNLIMYVKN